MTRSALVRRQAFLILACAALAGAAAWAVTASLPRRFCAGAGVSVVSEGNDVSPWGRDAALRRRALLALVPDRAVAEAVLARFGDNLPLDLRAPEALLGCIQADDAAGDVLRIQARTGDAELSARLADAWAEAYVQRTNATQAFSADVELRRSLDAAYAEAERELRVAEAALAAHEASSRVAELRARRDRAQALLSRVALQRAELVRDVWARLHRERMKRAERDACSAPPAAAAPPSGETGLLAEIRGFLAGLGARHATEARRVEPISRPKAVSVGATSGLSASGGLTALKAADTEFAALEQEDATRWEPVCSRLSGEVAALSTRITLLDAERSRLEERQRVAARKRNLLMMELLSLVLKEATRAPLVRFALSAVPPALPEGPDPRSVPAVAAAVGALAAFVFRPRLAVEPSPVPRVFDVLP